MKQKNNAYKEIIQVFLRLGLFAFGGPAAHIAMMEDEIVTKRKWVTKDKFMDMLGFTNLIPGPNSTEMAIHLGFIRGGRIGLFLAGISFILPAMLIVLVLAMIYQSYGTRPSVSHIFDGVQPVILAVVIQALYRLSTTIVKKKEAIILFIAILLLSLLGISEIPLLITAGILMLSAHVFGKKKNQLKAVDPMSLGLLFFTFLKIGSVLYGSGYVLLAFLNTEFIAKNALMTNQQLLDAVAVGQFTPGPVFTTATFIGYLIHGLPGAILATVGIFLPSFLLVFFFHGFIDRMRSSSVVSYVLDGVNAASLALMTSVTLDLAKSMMSVQSTVLFLISAFLMIRYKVNSTYLIIGAGMLSFILSLFL
ncbi:MAG: putative chromate transport protein [Herbinix sp.]|jgi:chromate transporter|nr:putative chromate transport protein [Herbinix sp.]